MIWGAFLTWLLMLFMLFGWVSSAVGRGAHVIEQRIAGWACIIWLTMPLWIWALAL